jgi:hypothetical protein
MGNYLYLKTPLKEEIKMTYSVKTIYPQFKNLTAHKAVMKRFETARNKLRREYAYKNDTAEMREARVEDVLKLGRSHHIWIMMSFEKKMNDWWSDRTSMYKRSNRRHYSDLIRKVVVLVTPESMYYERRGAFYEMMMERDRVLGMRRSLPDEIVNEIMTYL